MLKTQVQSPGWEDPLEKEMVTHSSILAWKIPWTERPGRLQAMGKESAKSRTRLSDFTFRPRTVIATTQKGRRCQGLFWLHGFREQKGSPDLNYGIMLSAAMEKHGGIQSSHRISHLQCLLNLEPRRKTAKIQQKAHQVTTKQGRKLTSCHEFEQWQRVDSLSLFTTTTILTIP